MFAFVQNQNTFLSVIDDGAEGSLGNSRRSQSEPTPVLSEHVDRSAKEGFAVPIDLEANVAPKADVPKLEPDGSTAKVGTGRKFRCINPSHKGNIELVHHVELLGGVCKGCYERQKGRKVKAKQWKNDTCGIGLPKESARSSQRSLRCIFSAAPVSNPVRSGA